MAERSDAIPFRKFDAIFTVNKEIIARINQHPSSVLVDFAYSLKIEEGRKTLELVEQKITKQKKQLLTCWKPSVQLRPIKDLFNDKIDWTCKRFEDVVHLNDQLHEVCHKYEMFEGTSPALEAIQNFLTNMEILQQLLGEIESILQPPDSKMQEVTPQIQAINTFLSQAKKRSEERANTLNLHMASVLTWDPQQNSGLHIDGNILSSAHKMSMAN
eukprot:TRINITY_DN3857_c0_g1_i1.p1 TRINITY_DN3857_c0_g1~~TRINITY_DN3857_c0_g1_i1.p1  ORF type:complete len:242 (+),score=44.63 TRINITY_DN3857_c0_g1_i1:82-726(+)